MKIKYVTLTGADDNVSCKDLFSISSDYSFVEWGILISQSKSGIQRYPSWDWIVDLDEMYSGFGNFSAHLCGKWVDDAINGQYMLDMSFFNRVQLNMAGGRLVKALHSDSKVWEAVLKIEKDVIFGGPYQDIHIDEKLFIDNGVFPLFDSSGGRGQLSKIWPKPLNLLCGYAGGLGPHNLKEELKRIEDVVGDAMIWIDMESRIRTNGEFDINLCKNVCEIVGDYV